ncbi:extracellular solute-binding protein [Sphingopyxis sp. RIFCSPHIGHO2_12_FULL_65_19]|uniref:extracellular solute-binding protein n=1 Tax=Sphingopyxis sp. RIFCSPHIGHO2_12_FULL_65_19 TaxID=1802172 RepID=UPI0008BD7FE6|nr:extracellular solute-binding protein [Sphingopyxis sp. RIFCSPHIGHO2_12_FULL_65_19]OHD05804.1 MAG: ABC transporter substrate-binding protein [Sphingopyxis sp. RIFCSPHIGHO2_12_FULL_65_19]
MQVTRRQLTGALAALPLLPTLGACGARRDGALTIWAMGNEGANLPALLKTLTLPAAMPPIEVQPLPWTAAHEKLLTGFAGGSLPAIGQVGNSWIAEMAAIGALAPVPPSAQPILADQFAAVVDTNRIAGKIWAVPWYVDTRLQFYRKDLFARAGHAAPPADWTGWKAALHQVKRQAGEGNYALLYPLNEYEQLTTLALSAGARMLRDNGARGAFSDPEFKAALAFYKSLFDERLAPMASAAQISNVWNEFARGYFSTFLSGPWTIGDMENRLPAAMRGKWGTAPNPGPNGIGSAAPGGSSLVVFAGTENPGAAWDVLTGLLSPAAQLDFHALTGSLPARRSVWQAAGLASDPAVAPFATQLDRATPLPKVPEWERIVTEMQVVAERMVRGQYGVDEAAAEIDRRADRLLEKRRWMLDKGKAL